jgi:integrase
MGNKVDSVKKSLKKAATKIGLPWISPHVFRHSAAVWMAEDGVPMEEIAQYLGHSNTEITRRVYARFSPDYLRNAAKALEL